MENQREINGQEKALVKDWNKRLDEALKRVEKEFKRFEKNRKLLSGKKNTELGESERMRANLHFANMAALLPQVYAKDPEYVANIAIGIPNDQQKLLRQFAETSEKLITKFLVKDGGLKKQAKKLLRSVYATSIGWLKVSWQENRRQDPLILNQIKDTQDNINRIQMLRAEMDDPSAAADHELQIAQLQQTLAGLEVQQEITVARGIALDFVMSEDVLVLDDSVRSISDYPRASALAHRVWMTCEQYKSRFGYEPKKAKSYSEKSGVISADTSDGKSTLLCVWEIWSQDDNRIYYVCNGEEGFCEEPKSPDWTGKRWFPFFLLAFNEIDGSFYPLSDIELTEMLVDEYNRNREDFVRDRQAALPLNVIREGGSLSPQDLEKLKNRQGGDMIVVKGVPGTPLSSDIFSGSLANLNPQNYDTSASRSDIEMIIGGGDAARGTVTKAKTATEAEILSQGLRGRSAERTDILEDLLNELGPYALEMIMRKVSEEEAKTIVGPEAKWPTLSIDEIFNQINIEVRGGSTGKPDRLQEQDRWIKLLPVIKEAVQQVSELRQQGQNELASAVIELTRETLRRFDERLDIEQFLPPPSQEQDDPAALKQQLATMKQQLDMAMSKAKEATELVERGYVQAAAQIATSQQPMIAAQAFQQVLMQVEANEMQETGPAEQNEKMMQAPMEQQPPVAPMVSDEPQQLQ